MSNFTGTGMGVSLVLPVSWQTGSITMAAVCLIFIFWRGGAYSVLEKGHPSACVIITIACFAIAFAASGGPDWGAF